jgi:hypothetical protein
MELMTPIGLLTSEHIYFAGGMLLGGLTGLGMMTILIRRVPKPKIQVEDIVYDKHTHRMEVKVKNIENRVFYLKDTALRYLATKTEEVTQKGRIPMLSGSLTHTRQTWDLLGEQESKIILNPGESKVISYELMLPKEFVSLEENANIRFSMEGYEVETIGFGLDRGQKIRIKDGSVARAGHSMKEFNAWKPPHPFLVELLERTENSDPKEIAEFLPDIKMLYFYKTKDEFISGKIAELAGTPKTIKRELISLLWNKLNPPGRSLR